MEQNGERKVVIEIDGILSLAKQGAKDGVDVGATILSAYAMWAYDQSSPSTAIAVGIGCLRRMMVELVGLDEAKGDRAVGQEILAVSRIGGADDRARFGRILAALMTLAGKANDAAELLDFAAGAISARRSAMTAAAVRS